MYIINNAFNSGLKDSKIAHVVAFNSKDKLLENFKRKLSLLTFNSTQLN
jgi:hypothetical protein